MPGERGAPGAPGPQGERGPAGEAGPAGTARVASVREAREVTTSSQFAPWPLIGNIWTQGADETNLLFGQAEVSLPTACDGEFPSAHVSVFVDGEFVGSGSAPFHPQAPPTQRIGLFFHPVAALTAPDVDANHIVTARVLDTCTGADQNFTFTSFQLDVVGVG